MSADTQLLSLFIDSRDTYERFAEAIPKHLLEDDTRMLIDDMGKWYNMHQDCESLEGDTLDDFWGWAKIHCHANRSKDKLDLMVKALKRAIEVTGVPACNEILKTLTLRDWAGRIADKADRYSAGETGVDFFEQLLDDVESAKADAGIHDKHDWEVRTNIRDILARIQDPGTGLNWRSPNLAASLGPLRAGKLVVVAAFVDTGKSTWLASEATYMASQLSGDEKVLYLNNEEGGDDVKLRLWKASLGLTTAQIDANPHAEAEYAAHMGGDPERIVLVDNSRITPGMIRKKLRQYNVKLVVVDQAYKVRVGKRGQEDKLGALQDTFEWFRGVAKEYCPVIGIHQARGDANGERYIEMHQLAGSQQALQGEADAIITLGRDLEIPAARYIYVPKNKMEGSDNPEIRNIKAEVFPKFSVARFDE